MFGYQQKIEVCKTNKQKNKQTEIMAHSVKENKTSLREQRYQTF